MTLSLFNALLVVVLAAAGALAFARRRAVSAAFAMAAVALYIALPASAFVVVGVLLLLIVVGTPLFVTILAATLAMFYFLTVEFRTFDSYGLFIEKVFGLTDKSVLVAIPFFVVAGSIMTAGGIARRLIDFAEAVVGWLPGGMGAAVVVACMLFAAISGSSPVTVIAIGSVMMPALLQQGYSERFSLGLVTSAGSLGILIPPSIPMIVYAIVVTGAMAVNVADLFIAGVVPGFFVAGLLIAYSVVHGARRPGFSWGAIQPPSAAHIGRCFVRGIWALLLPVLILGGIYPIFGDRGIFTATEAAAIAVVYALLIELFVHRELKLRDLPNLLSESALLMGSLLAILIVSFCLNHFLVDQQVADAAVAWLTSLDLGKLGFLILLNLFLLLVGFLMEILSAITIIAPLVAPIAVGFGIDPIHLAIIFIVNLEIGYLTPPIGINLFVSSSLFRKRIGEVTRAVLPFTLIMLFGLAAVTWFEPISTGLPRWLAGGSFFGGPREASDRSLQSDGPDGQGAERPAPEGAGIGGTRHPSSGEGPSSAEGTPGGPSARDAVGGPAGGDGVGGAEGSDAVPGADGAGSGEGPRRAGAPAGEGGAGPPSAGDGADPLPRGDGQVDEEALPAGAPRARSLEELMREARERRQRATESAGDSPDPGPTDSPSTSP